jgi:hypothetical protein
MLKAAKGVRRATPKVIAGKPATRLFSGQSAVIIAAFRARSTQNYLNKPFVQPRAGFRPGSATSHLADGTIPR